MTFEGKTLLLTGAAGGIGAAVAKAFGAVGANLVLTDLTVEAVESVVGDLGIDEARVEIAALDVTDAIACEQVVKKAQARFGGVDTLVPNAGVYRHAVFAAMTVRQWRGTMDVNLDGVFNTIRAALPAMRPGGCIVNLASRAAHCGGSFGHSHYGASKGALLALTRGLAPATHPQCRCPQCSPQARRHASASVGRNHIRT